MHGKGSGKSKQEAEEEAASETLLKLSSWVNAQNLVKFELMSVVIRLARTGKKGERKFRIVVKEKRSKRDGDSIETLFIISVGKKSEISSLFSLSSLKVCLLIHLEEIPRVSE